ncbi:MarR family transcriptional regulator [Brevibacillus fortis]|uniref:Transcriptional regulator n=1 Tax=Brevibacillus fortis TaxID=2126352 RepID=A0A2P7UW11_9BACL|nr:MarR family transcriptional regulator [Brevibacillus fortis]MED1784072.1 MarR family transcriptional regulator [Brevibacillus fortis]PSJ91156.1 transcriptional regulator [Brevibacillus fortis]
MDPKKKIWNRWITFLHKQEERSKLREELLLREIRSSVSDYDKVGRLSITELHVLQEVGEKDRVNVTTIAQQIGVTKSAISKITVKLMKKGLLERYQLEDNQKEVFFRLTSVGEMVNEIHERYHQQLENDMYRFLDRYTPAEMAFLEDVIREATEE